MSDAKQNDTIDRGLNLVNKPANNDFDAWKLKELGMQMTLLGLAEVQAERVKNLSRKVYLLEEEVFSDDKIADMDPRRAIELYTMAVNALNDSSRYIKDTVRSVNWDAIELQLAALSSGEAAGTNKVDSDIAKTARELLTQLSSQSATFLDDLKQERSDSNTGSDKYFDSEE